MISDQTAAKLIRELCINRMGPGNKKVRVIDMQRVRFIATRKKIALRDVEISCLENDIIPLRYLRNIGTIGLAGQLKLLRSTVAVCGAGGLGGTIIELLARQGVGNLVIIDKGRFVESNLNRQIMALESNLRRSKVKAAAARVEKINSATAVTAINKTINSRNVEKIIKNAGVVLDGLDNLTDRQVVAGACNKMNIPFVHGAIAGFSGQLMTIFPGDKGLGAICGPYTDENGCGVETLTGNPAATAAIIAAWEVQEAIKIITGIGEPIRNRLLFLDFAGGFFDEIPLAGDGK
jgi:molybdopterin/thiamine biosynthesis adenylyltransferase